MDIAIRPATVEDAAGIARVHVDSWRTTYQGIVPDEVLANLSYEKRQAIWERYNPNQRQDYRLLVAVDETGRIVGFADSGLTRDPDPDYPGELYAIYLLRECQGQGVGRMLVNNLVASMLTVNISAMLVKVLAENPACRFYEALGARYLRTEPIEIGGTQLDERVYGWADTRLILQR
ncbi:MAG TPA: GNAT family N-acetyltransferase [Ktedonobacteraceae bacterium]|jgi:ribosomal protein S18 acetylase RimI-like enzyme|nr:GNAT family N-acetyltransferase [Ktedonobacteraceae bacterium]